MIMSQNIIVITLIFLIKKTLSSADGRCPSLFQGVDIIIQSMFSPSSILLALPALTN